MPAVFPQASNIIIADAALAGRAVFKNGDLVSVIPVQAIPGTKPHKAPAILINGFYGIVRQPLVAVNMTEFQPGPLGNRRVKR